MAARVRGCRLSWHAVPRQWRWRPPQQLLSTSSSSSSSSSGSGVELQPLPRRPGSDPGGTGRPLRLARALVVTKRTRLDAERLWHSKKQHGSWSPGDCSLDAHVRRKMAERGSDFDVFKARHDVHMRNLDACVRLLSDHGISVETATAADYQAADLTSIDAIFSAGGDGTFLTAASRATIETPVIGLNTDPESSRGELCLHNSERSLEHNLHAPDILQAFLRGDFRWIRRYRIRVTLSDGDNNLEVLPVRALNEVFIAESLSYKTSYYVLSVDGRPSEVQKSSGLLVSTGTGSTAWVNSEASLSRACVQKVLSYAGLTPSDELVEKVVSQYNGEVVFPGDTPQMFFVVRAPINNSLVSVKVPQGRCSGLVVQSRSWECHLSLDGFTRYDFNHGRQAKLELLPEDMLTSATVTP